MRKLAWDLRNRLIESLAASGDRFLYALHLYWLNERGWAAPFQKYLERDKRPDRPETRILDRRFTLIEFAKAVRKLPGSTAECGVLRGVGSALICKALSGTYGPQDRHFGFDSFEGLPEPKTVDADAQGNLWWAKGDLTAPYEGAKALLEEFSFCQLVKGWIPDSLETAKDLSFRLVHVDVDLHEPLKDSLSFFYPRMVRGGVILVDDFGFLSCPGARRAAREFFEDKPEAIVELATGQAIAIKL